MSPPHQIRARINHLSSSLEALEQELADQKVAGLNSNRTLWEKLMQQGAQRTQELNDLRAGFSDALDATKKDLAAEVTNRANDTADVRGSVAFESGRCTQDFQGLRTQIAKDGEAAYATRLADVKRLRDELVKESGARKEEAAELRGEIASVGEAAKKLVEEKNGGINNGATSKKRSAASRYSEEVTKDLRREMSSLRAELQQERIIREKMLKILEDVAEQTFNNHEMIKSLNVRLDIVKDYTLLPLAEGIIHGGAAAEGQGNAGEAGAAVDGQ